MELLIINLSKMNKTERKKYLTSKIVDMLIKDWNIHTIERDNQYIRFWMDDTIYGSLDTRDFNIDLNDDECNGNGWSFFEDYELLMNKKVREIVAS
jgi:hypothetical protein|tara:strand:+ start:142 stop:429 length:288 start_codon:yes stop_codon:yes gene_type:complete